MSTLQDFVRELGGIPLTRIRLHPAPGTADESHLLAAAERDGYCCELVDGTLVERAMEFTKSALAALLMGYLFRPQQQAGLVVGAGAMTLLAPGLVRSADVAYFRWSKLPGGNIPTQPLPDLAPCFAAEVIGQLNTVPEMQRKAGEYLAAGTELFWVVDPGCREVRVHTRTGTTAFREGDILDGGPLLSGQPVAVTALFNRLPPPA